MSRSNYEKETIINYNEDEGNASVYTHHKSLQTRLGKLLDLFPEKVSLIKSGDGWVEYLVPKRWVKISPPRKVSDEAKEAFAERMKKYRNENMNT